MTSLSPFVCFLCCRHAKKRINAPMIPHALRTSQASQSGANNGSVGNGDGKTNTPMSNDAFRNLFNK